MAQANIINNKDRYLRDRISELTSKSQELKFLVGFFYFSGLLELFNCLKKNPNIKLNVLVGLNVDQLSDQLVEYAMKTKNDSERIGGYISSVKTVTSNKELDSELYYEQINYFINAIKEDRLVIRKTREPNHSKLYIFKMDEESKIIRESIFITGSSNLTRAGLVSQGEFNIEVSDSNSEEAEIFFDELWVNSVKITEDDVTKDRLIKTLEEESIVAKITPFEAFVLVLKNYVEYTKQQKSERSLKLILEEAGYTPYQYQIDAVTQALAMIEKYNGAIISDVVGLGKSIVGSLVGRMINKKGLILCPPGLIGDNNNKSGWRMYRKHFGLYSWEIKSSGNLEDAFDYIKNNDIDVVIIDEAHRFRNQDTRDHELLRSICRDKIVLLLTATPFNNSPADIYSLLKLFIVSGKSELTLNDDLDIEFSHYNKVFKDLSYIKKYIRSSDDKKRKQAESKYRSLFGETDVVLEIVDKNVLKRARALADRIRSVIEPVTIRRNRLDLKNDPVYSKEVTQLSEIADPPIEEFYELTDEQSKFYDEVILEYFGDSGKFKGAIYQPFRYQEGIDTDDSEVLGQDENRQSLIQKNLYDFMKRLLVKRFESSFGAFQKSIENFERVTQLCINFVEKTGVFILDRKLIEKIYEDDLDVIQKHLDEYVEVLENGNYPKSYQVYRIKEFKQKDGFLQDMHLDLALFAELRKKINSLELVKSDPKVEKLINSITNIISGNMDDIKNRKVIIFTEYTDTALYLKPLLEEAFYNKVLSVTNDLNTKIDAILKNFDASYSDQEDQYQILLATDKMSEGFNLNRAGSIVNYDIPWNPTRVIQRVGRINRIGKKVFDFLYIHNFFPTLQGSDIIKSRQIAAEKMFMIHNVLGEDAKIFDEDETPHAASLYDRVSENPENFEKESFQTSMRREYMEISKQYPEIINNISKLPNRVKVAKKSDNSNLVTIIRKGLGFFIRTTDQLDEGSPVLECNIEQCHKLIECSPDTPGEELSPNFWKAYAKISDYKENLRGATSTQSVEIQARNNLESMLKLDSLDLAPHKVFIENLLEDMYEYKTLSEFTERSIKQLDFSSGNKIRISIEKIEELKDLLGGDKYLDAIKERAKKITQDVIISVENQK